MHTLFTRVRTFVITHVKTSIAIGIVVLGGGYLILKPSASAATTYMLGTVERGTVVASITQSGQVSAGRSLDIKPQASGNVVYTAVKEGQNVSQGQLLVELDATDAEKSVRDAEANVESAKISLAKIQEPADQLTLIQAKNALQDANAALASAYQSGQAAVVNTFLNLPNIMTGLDSALHGTDVNTTSGSQINEAYYMNTAFALESSGTYGKAQAYKEAADSAYDTAKASYDKTFYDYKNAGSTSDAATNAALLNETYATTKLVADAVKAASSLIQYYQDQETARNLTPLPKSNSYLSSLVTDASELQSALGSLSNAQNSIVSDTASVPEKQASLDKVESGADSLDVQSAELNLTKAENSLQDAKDNLANYYVRAPFSGTVAKLDVKTGDPASSGAAVATLIATDQVVDIPLNEVDVSKVKVGDKATLTFDAVDGLSLTGKVASIDTVGTVTQGVVNYTVTISFDSTDPRVKPGMSTTASIITDVHPDVLTVPSSAVKSNAGGSYVLAFPSTVKTTAGANGGVTSDTSPDQIPVTVGISDDTSTEIVSGLAEGQSIVTRSVAAQTKTTTGTSAPSILGGAGGGNRGAAGGGQIRRIGG